MRVIPLLFSSLRLGGRMLATAACAKSATAPPAGCAPTGAGVCYYVEGAAGKDANSGVRAQPFRTLSKAAGVVNPGDVVMVRNGVHAAARGGSAIAALSRAGTAVYQSELK